MPTLRDVWQAWDGNPASVGGRRFIYCFFGPFGTVGLCLMLLVGQWVAAGFMAFFLAMALVSGVRTPGTRAYRVAARLHRKP